MSGAGRPLLAARTSSGENSKEGSSPGSYRPPPGGRQKRTLIESACSACRRRKSRCDGLRPSCSRCQNLRTDCQYEAEEGESRWSALRRRNQILEAERDQLRELLGFVQTRSEPDALEIFQRIRASHSDDLFLLLRQIKDSTMNISPSMGLPPHMSGTSGGVDHRLPPIQTILDAPARQIGRPAHLHHSQSLSSEDSRSDVGSVPPPAAIHPHLRAHTHLDTLEPTFQQQHPPQLVASMAHLSSEESTGSLSSTSGDPPLQVYHLPRDALPEIRS